MSNNKKQTNKKYVNPLLIVAIVVGAVAIATVLLVPDKKGKDVPNTSTFTVDSNTSQSTNTTQSTNTSQESNTIANELNSSENAIPAELNDDGDVVIKTADITEKATFYTLDVEGTTVSLFALIASDGTIRTAFDTCQICNGSPYAFFVQLGDKFQCQNCGNIYNADMIEQERGGCNPVPIMADEKTVTDTEIIIPAELIQENSIRFENWKKF